MFLLMTFKTNPTMARKKRSDRNHIVYEIINLLTGASYIGVTAAIGRRFQYSAKLRLQKHFSRAKCENKNWNFCKALRQLADCQWQYEVLDVVRGRKNAHQAERELIGFFEPSLNTF